VKPLGGGGGGGGGLGAAVVRGAEGRGAVEPEDRGVVGALDVGAATVVVGSPEVEVVGASVLDVVSGTERPTATFVEASLWVASAVPAAARSSTTVAARPRTAFRPPTLPLVLVIAPLLLLGEDRNERAAPLPTNAPARR